MDNDRTAVLGASRDTTSEPSAASMRRRTLISGAAWSIPAVVLASTSPAFASSGLQLQFDRATYSGSGCSVISGVAIMAVIGGARSAGQAITVSLSDGFTFASNATSYTGTTDGQGVLTLPDINVPATGGTATASGSAAGASSVSASLTGSRATTALYMENLTPKTPTNVPVNSTPVFASWFLAPDGRLIDGAGVVRATDVASFGQIYTAPNGDYYLPMVKTDGNAVYMKNLDYLATTGVPNGSKPVFATWFVAPDGRLVDGASAGLRASNVDRFGQVYSSPSGDYYLPLLKKDGAVTYMQNLTETDPVRTTTAVFASWFLAADGRLIDGGSGAVRATDIASFGQIYSPSSGEYYLPMLKTDGTPVYMKDLNYLATTGVPNKSTPVFSTWFLAPDGRLIDGVTGAVRATDVSKFGQVFLASTGDYYLPLLKTDGTPAYMRNLDYLLATGVPNGAQPVFATWFLGSDGRLIDGGSGTVRATEVSSFGQIYSTSSGDYYLPMLKRDGTPVYMQNLDYLAATGVPSGSKPIFATWFLASDGRVIDGASGGVRATNIASFGQVYLANTGDYYLPMLTRDNTAVFMKNLDVQATTGVPNSKTGVPRHSTPVFGSWFLTSDGRLMDGTGVTRATDVSSFGQIYAATNGDFYLPLVRSDGSAAYMKNLDYLATTGVPSGSKPVFASWFLSPDGRFVDGASGAVRATDVVSFGEVYTTTGGDFYLPYTASKSSC